MRPSAGRSKPLASSAARSLSGVPSIHSSVSTSRAVRSQSTAGTRKSVSSRVFSAISESAAASSRKSISIATERASVATASTGRSRCASSDRLSALRAAKKKASRSDLKRRSMPGRRIFTATGFARAVGLDLGAMHLRDRGGGDRRARSWHRPRSSGLPKAAATTASASLCGNGAILSCRLSRSRAICLPTTSGRVARNWPSLT